MILEATQSTPIKAFMQLIPGGIGGFIDTFFADIVRQVQEEREQVFFAELDAEKFEITDDVARNHKFIHCFIIAARAAMRSNHHEKIRLFARMVCKAQIGGVFEAVDEFEEIVSAIDDLSFREWSALIILDELKKDKDTARRRIIDELLVPSNEIDSFLGRIERSGMLQRGGISWGGSGISSEISPMFYRVLEFVARRTGGVDA